MTIFSHGSAAALAYWGIEKSRSKSDSQELGVKTLFWLFFMGILPDLPLTFVVVTGQFDPAFHHHHTWITHTPIFWLCAAGGVAFFSRMAAGQVLLGTWLHLAMDWYGGGDGIAFLYPFDQTQYGFLLTGIHGRPGLEIYLGQWYFAAFEGLVIGGFLLLAGAASWRSFSEIRKKG